MGLDGGVEHLGVMFHHGARQVVEGGMPCHPMCSKIGSKRFAIRGIGDSECVTFLFCFTFTFSKAGWHCFMLR
jgi:hypothetical protein